MIAGEETTAATETNHAGNDGQTATVEAHDNHQPHHHNRAFCHSWRKYMKEKRYISPAVFVLFLSYNTIATAAARMFQCRSEVIDGHRYLAADLAVTCYDSQHIGGMIAAAGMALLFNVGFPIGLVMFLRRHVDKLSNAAVMQQFGFLYQGYSLHRRRYGWEAVVLLRKFAIVMVASTLTDPWYQAIGGIGIVVTALLVQVTYKPYDDELFNRLECWVLAVLAATQVLSLVYLRSLAVVGAEGTVAAAYDNWHHGGTGASKFSNVWRVSGLRYQTL